MRISDWSSDVGSSVLVIQNRYHIGIAGFSLPSWKPLFHIVNVEDGQSRSFLVAHGRGSDPAHQGWLQRFSNLPGSSATSSGAYLTGSDYQGQHGLSQRLTGQIGRAHV